VTTDTTQSTRAANRRRRLVGVVTSDKMDKTITVEVIRLKLEPKYKKYIRVRSRYKAHDEDNKYRIGDKVEIVENRPISRTKRWQAARLVERAEGELS
jgi:small subunit ribosomal protein S17